MDRIRATRLAVSSIDWIQEAAEASMTFEKSSSGQLKRQIFTKEKTHACVNGIRGGKSMFTPVEELVEETDLKNRRNKRAWWMDLNHLTRLLAKYEYYEELVQEEF